MGTDPLRNLLTSADSNLVGVAVESDADLHSRLLANTKGRPGFEAVQAKITPSNVWDVVRVGLRAMRPSVIPESADARIHVDFVKIDIDGYDCVVIEALLKHVVPSFLFLEINPSIPPPFQFVRHYHEEWRWHPTNFSRRAEAAEGEPWIPTFGCSFSYAVRRLAQYKLYLLRLEGGDAVFVHAAHVAAVYGTFGVRVPYDELQCYRDQRLWASWPLAYVREWFFAPDVYEILPHLWGNLTDSDRAFNLSKLPFALFL